MVPRNSASDLRRTLCGTTAAPDLDKAMVMRSIAQLAVDGLAEWELLDNGDVRLRLETGETYLFTRLTVHRTA